MLCPWVQDSLRTVFKCRGLAPGSSGKLWYVRVFPSISTLCELPKDLWGFPGGSDGKELACNAGDLWSIPASGRSPGEEHGNPLQWSCLENPHGQRRLEGYDHGVTESDTTERLRTAREMWEFWGTGSVHKGTVPAGWSGDWARVTRGQPGCTSASGDTELVQRQLVTSFPPASHAIRHDLAVRVFRNVSRN